MTGSLIHPGTGFFAFSDSAVPASGSIRVFYSCPQSGVGDAPIVIAMHGLDRAAAAFRDVLVPQASCNRQLVIVPEFDARQFPDVFAYNFGGVRRPPPNNIVLPRDQWNFHVIENLFQHIRVLLRSNQKIFGLFGNSAGSQYVLRYLALNEAPSVDLAVASNGGVYMLPDLTLAYPLGMGGLDLNENHVRRYLGRRLISFSAMPTPMVQLRTCLATILRWPKAPTVWRVVNGISSIVRRSRSGWVHSSAGDFKPSMVRGT
jgi:hypothetical protein